MNIIKELKGSDQSVKFLLRLEDGNSIEALYMHDHEQKLTYHSTVCVSSQIGCAMGCRFCATGEQGFIRNLQKNEILEQVTICDTYRQSAGLPPIDAVVFAGMGEPLLNYENVLGAMLELRAKLGIISFELATVGIVPRIYELITDLKDSGLRLRLNLSLHGSTDEIRSGLMPVNKKFGLRAILKAAADYASATDSKARIRYMLIKNANDSDEDVRRLTSLLSGLPVKLILSEYNDNHINGLLPAKQLDVINFYNEIKGQLDCELFHNFGGDINGGCGQLRRKEEEKATSCQAGDVLL
jgi:23S rRNA (adenine2503-C2)-methyltransferase